MQHSQETVLLRKQDPQGANIEITTDQEDQLHVYANGLRKYTQKRPDPHHPTRKLTTQQALKIGLNPGATALGPVHLTRSETETLELTWAAASTRVSDQRLTTQRRALRLKAIVLADAIPERLSTRADPSQQQNREAMLQELQTARQQLVDWDRDHPEFLARHPTLARHNAQSIMPRDLWSQRRPAPPPPRGHPPPGSRDSNE